MADIIDNEEQNNQILETTKDNLIERIEAQGTILGHPKGLFLLFFTELWERFSYYGMRAILILYMTKLWIENGLEIPESSATLIYGFFTGFVYFTPIIGGWIDKNKVVAVSNGLTGDVADLAAGQATLSNMLLFPAILIVAFAILYFFGKKTSNA